MLSFNRNWFAIALLICINLQVILCEAAVFQQLPPLEKHPGLIQAESFYKLGDFKKAIQSASVALGQIDGNRDPENQVLAYIILGGSHLKSADFGRAIDMLEKAATLASVRLTADHELLGELHYQMGLYFDRAGNGQKSLEHLQTSLQLRLQRVGEKHVSVGEVYSALGELYLYTILDFRSAKTWFEMAVDILEPVSPESDIALYFPYFCLSEVNRRLGDHDTSLTFAFKALEIVRSRPEYRRYLERCYSLLGDVYYSRTEFQLAIENYKAGIAENIHNEGPASYYLIRKYTNLGVALGESGQSAEAVACFKRSLKISSQYHHPNAELSAENFLHLGRLFQKTGASDSARHFLNLYLRAKLKDYGPNHTRTAEAYRYIARSFSEAGNYDSAAFYIQRSLKSAIRGFDPKGVHANPSNEILKDRPSLFLTFADKGNILLRRFANDSRELTDLTTALECFAIADTLMQLSRNAYDEEGSKLFFADHYHNIYEQALEACYLLFDKKGDRAYVESALMFMEKSKAFLLAEALNRAELFSRAGLPDSLRERERHLNTALATYRSQLENDSDHGAPDAQARQQIQAKIFDITRTRERLVDTIARLYPSYYQVKYQEASGFPEIQSYAKNNDAAFIEYFWGNSAVFVLAVTGEKIVLRKVTGPAKIESDVATYFSALRQPSWKENDPSFEVFTTTSNDIYRALLEPVMTGLSVENVVIIRDGPLLMIPFESLVVSKGNEHDGDYRKLDYLIRHHTVSYAHSADLLLKGLSKPVRSTPQKKILAVSYSASSGSRAPIAGVANELPGAAREITAISQILPGTFLLGDEATEEKFKSLAADYDILHLAVHGRSDPEKQFSGSLFFRESPGTPEDGELHVYELYDLALKARLAVLSSCESGVGKIFRGEGVFSIARGFAYAGCPSTVMTLWPVSDVAGAQIMGPFYTSLSKGDHIDAALRQAKLNYLENSEPQLAHPAYWAAYIATGNMNPVIPPPFPFKMLWIVVAVLFGVVVFYVLRSRQQIKNEVNEPTSKWS